MILLFLSFSDLGLGLDLELELGSPRRPALILAAHGRLSNTRITISHKPSQHATLSSQPTLIGLLWVDLGLRTSSTTTKVMCIRIRIRCIHIANNVIGPKNLTTTLHRVTELTFTRNLYLS